jgi:hypothetical protein
MLNWLRSVEVGAAPVAGASFILPLISECCGTLKLLSHFGFRASVVPKLGVEDALGLCQSFLQGEVLLLLRSFCFLACFEVAAMCGSQNDLPRVLQSRFPLQNAGLSSGLRWNPIPTGGDACLVFIFCLGNRSLICGLDFLLRAPRLKKH